MALLEPGSCSEIGGTSKPSFAGVAGASRRILKRDFGVLAMNLKPAVERGAEAQLIQPSGLTQKPQLTHRVSLHFCASPSS